MVHTADRNLLLSVSEESIGKVKMVHILLSTYNGEKYIREQLESIFAQTYRDICLYIRDDGSTDSTVEQIEQYLTEFPEYASRTQWIPNENHENLGYMQSFWKLLESAPGADYYAFCDQDDVWLPQKVEYGVKALEKEQAVDFPLLYFSNFYQCNEDFSEKKEGMVYNGSIKFENVLFYTPAFGFTIVINEKLRQMVLGDFDHTGLPHDGWVQKTAVAFGKIICDPECTAYYRRHESAVTANNASKASLIKNWLQNEILGNSMRETHDVLEKFYQVYGAKMKAADRELLELYATRSKKASVWWKRVCFREMLRPSVDGRVALRICFWMGRY